MSLRRGDIVADLSMLGTCLNAGACSHKLCNLVLRARAAIQLRDETEILRDELRERRACLVAARDDLVRITQASVEDGGMWIRAVAEGRVPYLEEAIVNTDGALNPDVAQIEAELQAEAEEKPWREASTQDSEPEAS